MCRARILPIGIFLLAIFPGLTACSKETPQPKTEQAASTSQAPAPPNQPAQTASAPVPAQPEPAAAETATPAGGKPAGPLATEKHSLSLTDYAGRAVTVSLNGAWVGQWDSNVSVPLDSVVQGKNQVTVELQGEAKNAEVTLYVQAQRAGQTVNLLQVHFQDKPAGTYTNSFVAR